jgi:hypothetical protein
MSKHYKEYGRDVKLDPAKGGAQRHDESLAICR